MRNLEWEVDNEIRSRNEDQPSLWKWLLVVPAFVAGNSGLIALMIVTAGVAVWYTAKAAKCEL